MQDPVTKAERYRKAADKYANMAKEAEVDYVAEIYRKVAMRYVFMAEDLLKWSERRRELDVNALAGVFLDRQAA
jgi:rubrerythrin